MGKKKRAKKSLLNGLVGTAAVVLVGMAISEQLRRPAAERTWQGNIFGIPYNFRLPNIEQVQNTFWNSETSQILVPHAFGMGWSINFYPLIHPKTID